MISSKERASTCECYRKSNLLAQPAYLLSIMFSFFLDGIKYTQDDHRLSIFRLNCAKQEEQQLGRTQYSFSMYAQKVGNAGPWALVARKSGSMRVPHHKMLFAPFSGQPCSQGFSAPRKEPVPALFTAEKGSRNEVVFSRNFLINTNSTHFSN